MPLDKETKKPLGFAYMLFMMPEHAVRALEDLDGSIFQVCGTPYELSLAVPSWT